MPARSLMKHEGAKQRPGRWRVGLLIVVLATAVRLVWALAVPTIPVGDFATYRESGMYLAEFGHFDRGFVYMPGLVVLLAWIHGLGGEVLAAKALGAVFGGLAAGPIYGIAAHLGDGAWGGRVGPRPVDGNGSAAARPVASVAALGYALWPAGIAMASVIGTDIPAAAVMSLALVLLCRWGDSRPRLAAAAFGAAMGLAAYFRAVALPLTVLSAGYWLARRAGTRATIGRTAIAIAMTVLVLLPWGLRNRRQSGEMYLTDSHGGITALMGNDPNTEGTYSRSVGIMFHELTGRTFLAEPHRETDRIAYRLAAQWMTFEPMWTLGMIALRCERLLAPERGLLYWPLYRPGVLPGKVAQWFNRYRVPATGLADLFYLLFVVGLCAGLSFAGAEKRWTLLVPLPIAVALAGTYALFVAEPRYRVTSEALLFPIAAYGWVRLAASARRAVASVIPRPPSASKGHPLAHATSSLPSSPSLVERRALIGTIGVLCALGVGAVVIVRGGAALRSRHRWATTVWHVDGQPQPAFWRRVGGEGGPSWVRGAPPAAALTLLPGRREVAAEIVLPNLELPAGPVGVTGIVAWKGHPVAGTRVAFSAADDPSTVVATVTIPAVGASEMVLAGHFDHPGGRVRLRATLSQPGNFSATPSALIGDIALTTVPAGEKR